MRRAAPSSRRLTRSRTRARALPPGARSGRAWWSSRWPCGSWTCGCGACGSSKRRPPALVGRSPAQLEVLLLFLAVGQRDLDRRRGELLEKRRVRKIRLIEIRERDQAVFTGRQARDLKLAVGVRPRRAEPA